MVCEGLRLRVLLLSTFCLLLGFTGRSAFAVANDCVEDDPDNGRFFCKNMIPDPMAIGPCDEVSANNASASAWCRAGGGTSFNAVTGDCPGFTPFTEENVLARSVLWGSLRHIGTSCTVTADTGWNASYTTNFCVNSTGVVYKSGYLIKDGRRLTLACGTFIDTISIDKGRNLVCPAGFSGRNVFRNGQLVSACTRPVKC